MLIHIMMWQMVDQLHSHWIQHQLGVCFLLGLSDHFVVHTIKQTWCVVFPSFFLHDAKCATWPNVKILWSGLQLKNLITQNSDLLEFKCDWSHSPCDNGEEPTLHDAPRPLDKFMTLMHHLDGNSHHGVKNCRSDSGVWHFVNQTPIDWHFKKQADI